MNKRWTGIADSSKKCLVALSALSLTAQILPVQPGWAAGIAKKAPAMQIPINLKLDDSAPEEGLTKETGAKADLTPMTLGSENKPDGGAPDTTASGVLNGTITDTEFKPKGLTGPSADAAPPVSIKDSKPLSAEDKLIKEAKQTNVLPLALMESRDETDRKLEAKFEAEKVQLTDLWNATLTRSPDIQFVTQKLLPSSNPGHTSAVMMKLLGTLMMGAMSAAYYASPSPMTAMGGSLGSSMIGQVLTGFDKSQNQKARLSETETIMLYNMVRTNADRLVENFRNYKKNMSQLKIAETDLIDLQTMARDLKMEPSEQIKTEYTLRKAQREISGIMEDARKYRQSLVDLAGGDAVAKLDKQMDEEHVAIDPALAEAQKEGMALAEPDAAKAAAIAAENSAKEAAQRSLEQSLAAKKPAQAVLAGVKPPKGESPAISHN